MDGKAIGYGDPIMDRFWDVVNRQDWAAVESVQRGIASSRFVPGVFVEREDAVYHFVTMVANAYLDRPVVRSRSGRPAR